MSSEKSKPNPPKNSPAAAARPPGGQKPGGPERAEDHRPKPAAVAAAPPKPAPGAPPVKPPEKTKARVPPLFRRNDWLSFGVTTVVVLLGYLYTLAPNLTLEDSGELAVASYYAGVPHPPGYPVWTLYTWLFTVLLPFSNIAWRVAVSSAVAGAFSCGLLALMVSRGSSMMLEGIAELKTLERRAENALCVTAGFVSGMLLGFNGFMWSQAVIVEVYTLSILSLMGVLCCLLRWLYAPHQRRYLYWAFFLFGICFNNHMTLIVAIMGIEVLIMAAHPRLGRDLLFGNSVVYILGLIAKQKQWLTMFDGNTPLFLIYNVVGIGSLLICTWLIVRTKKLFTEWWPFIVLSLCALAGALFYFYMPLASMTNPPLNWGYPRTWDGFKHALTRGQYERTNPTDILNDPGRFFSQLMMYLSGAIEEFNLIFLFIGLVPFLFWRRLQKRERAWLIGLSAIYLCLAVLLLVLLNPSTDRTSRELTKVFFTASHVIIAMAIGYGMTLIGGTLLTQYRNYRFWALVSSAVAAAIALFVVSIIFQKDVNVTADQPMFDLVPSENPLVRFTAVFTLLYAFAAIAVFLIYRKGLPLAAVLVLFLLMPVKSILSHWSDNEQRGHLFGYWFGHDMFTPPFQGSNGKPIYPEMTRDAILFGGTDPGRFNPTYMIFCESFIPPSKKKETDPAFDRRDVYLITQNALADGTYLHYIRAHYNRSAQIDPPFFQDMLRSSKEREKNLYTNALARAVAPLDRFFTRIGERMEKKRREKGVYPRNEIITPSPIDSQQAFNDYIMDAQRRLQANQLKPGEDVKIIDNRVQVSGQVAVMAINGLLTKVIFDKNPTNEFFIEESFPLDWMYPYLTPFGIIMKINRQPVAEISEETIEKDHEFWSQYSNRLIGNWITYDTPVSNICEFAERVYLRRDYRDFKGDPKFVRDDNAQKAFSKLRSSIGGVYAWRVNNPKSAVEQQRMFKEADFAFRQSFAYCPYSPEAVYRYVNLLANFGRFSDASMIARTCLKLDPYNSQVRSLVNQLETLEKNRTDVDQARVQVAQLEQQLRVSPTNVTAAFQLVSAYLQLQQTNAASQILDQIVGPANVDPQILLNAAQLYATMGNAAKLENLLSRLVTLLPDNAEAWYDLAAIQSTLGQIAQTNNNQDEANKKYGQALTALGRAISLSNERLSRQPTARNLRTAAQEDPRFAALRALPEYLKLFPPR